MTATGRRQEPVAGVAPMLEALRDRDCERFCEHFDVRLVSGYEEQFVPYRQLVVAWTRDRFRSRERIGLQLPRGRGSLVPLPRGNKACQARWTWPHPRFSQVCVLGLTRKAAAADDAPDDLRLEMRRTVTRQTYEGGRGVTLQAERSTLGCHVVVWVLIDLGFEKLYSEPLTLDTLRPSFGSRRNGPIKW